MTHRMRAYNDPDSGVYLHAGDVEQVIRTWVEKAHADPLGALTAPAVEAIADAVHDWATEAAR